MTAQAATIEVDPPRCSSPAIACTLAEAVDRAVSGDIIRIYNTGLTDASSATVNGSRLGTLTIETMDFSLLYSDGMTPTLSITNGARVTLLNTRFAETPGDLERITQTCVSVSASELTVENALFQNCVSGIAGSDSDLEVTGSVFQLNQGGGAIALSGGVSVEVTDSEFFANSAGLGGAISLVGIDQVVLEGNRFNNNSAGTAGGAVYMDNVEEAQIWSNVLQDNSSLTVLFEEVTEEEGETEGVSLVAYGRGGGMDLDVEETDLWDNLFCANLSFVGGGLYVDDQPDLEVTHNVFADNWAISYGGGLYYDSRTTTAVKPTVVNNTFVGNLAGLNPAPRYIVVIGGGGAMAFNGIDVDLRNNIVANTLFGGGIFQNDGENFIIGDPVSYDYNLFYLNCDAEDCDPTTAQDFTGDLAAYAVNVTNVQFADPQLVYYRGEGDCFPDAFYPQWDSPVVDNGDPTLTDLGGSISDIGAYGGPRAPVLDRDGDGFENIYDCNDLSADINPAAADLCDGLDNNCDGQIDENSDAFWYPDADRDGYGDANVFVPIFDCTDLSSSGFATNNDDCDDARNVAFPGAPEVCDALDNDCNGTIDDPDRVVFSAWVLDADGDGFGTTDPRFQTIACEPPATNYVAQGGDCDDANVDIGPGNPEVCDGIDNDCSGSIDDNPTDLDAVWYVDLDGDGVGSGLGVAQCDPPADGQRWVNAGEDCNDEDPLIYPAVTLADGTILPGAPDVCNDIDDDCTGVADDDITLQTAWYVDNDGDGLGENLTEIFSCDEQPDPYVLEGGDCDDDNPDVGLCEECGCQSTPGAAPAGFLAALAVLLVRRRRR